MPLAWAVPLTAAFGLFHGHAHGVELLAGETGLVTGLGFVLSTGGRCISRASPRDSAWRVCQGNRAAACVAAQDSPPRQRGLC